MSGAKALEKENGECRDCWWNEIYCVQGMNGCDHQHCHQKKAIAIFFARRSLDECLNWRVGRVCDHQLHLESYSVG